MIVHMRHVREADLCAKGARRWFASHNLSWSDFLENGISADIVSALDDAIANRVIDIARKEHSDGK